MNFKNLGFRDFLEDEEQVESIFRHSGGGVLSKILWQIVLWGGISWVVHFYLQDYYYDFRENNYYSWLFLIPISICAVKSWQIFMKWYGNAILMTSESLIFAEFTHLFDRKAVRIDYWDLDDIELEKKGMGDYLGNKGDLIFSKVGGGSPIEFKRVSNPRKIIKKIRDHKAKMLDHKNFTEESALRDLLGKMVQTHVRHAGQPEREKMEKKEFYPSENPAKNSEKFKISPVEKITASHHFHNELDDAENLNIEVEKELDDEGGLEIEL